MKKLIILFVLFSTLTAVAQTKGKVTGALFFNFHQSMVYNLPLKNQLD